jgi:hypothetical protein
MPASQHDPRVRHDQTPDSCSFRTPRRSREICSVLIQYRLRHHVKLLESFNAGRAVVGLDGDEYLPSCASLSVSCPEHSSVEISIATASDDDFRCGESKRRVCPLIFAHVEDNFDVGWVLC